MNWRLFLTLWLGAVVASLCVVPVLVTAAALHPAGAPMAWGPTVAAALIGAGTLYAGVVYLGIRMGPPLGLGTPIVEGLIGRRLPPGSGRDLATAAAIGLGAGALGVLTAVVIAPRVGAADGTAAEALPLWSGLALSVFAAVDEELLFRFGLMTLVVWIVARILPAPEGRRPSDFGMWIAIGITAVVFEAAHVNPVGSVGEAELAATRPLQFIRLAVAVALGWLYWTRGLEAAMTTHFAYNMVFFYGVVLAV